MKFFAEVTIGNTEIAQGKKDPTKEYLKVMFLQDMSAKVFVCPSVELFNLCDANKGKKAQIEVDENDQYGSKTLVDVIIEEA